MERMSTRILSAAVLLVMALASALPAAADPVTHIVAKGETLYGIAKRYGVAVDVLMATNGIEDPSRVLPGTKLVIPGAGLTYQVKKGDTLYGIARAYGVSVDDILKLNGLSSTVLKPGQVLRLPAGAVAPTGVATASPGAPTPAPAAPPATPGGKPAAAVVTTPPVAATAAGTPVVGTPVATIPATVPAAPAPKPEAKAVAWPVPGTITLLQGKLKGAAIAAAPGAAMTCLRAGTVVSAGPFRGFGLVAYVQSPDGLVYVYGGASRLDVRVGDPIRKGSVIGVLPTGSAPATGYFFVFKGADTVDPADAPRD